MKTIFISYAHKDKLYKNELIQHLSILERVNKIKIWHDNLIQPGQNWEKTILENLDKSDVILILISSNALSSDFINDIEIKKAMEYHQNNSKIVIPIILQPCLWKISTLATLQALPKEGKPISKWSNKNDAYLDILEGLSLIL